MEHEDDVECLTVKLGRRELLLVRDAASTERRWRYAHLLMPVSPGEQESLDRLVAEHRDQERTAGAELLAAREFAGTE
ncbi:MAG: hypothetical protein AAFQ77_03075 [Myxococcota bacterium]